MSELTDLPPTPLDVSSLNDIEAIKQLKAGYCRYLDAKDWDTWRGIFTDDFVSDISEAGAQAESVTRIPHGLGET